MGMLYPLNYERNLQKIYYVMGWKFDNSPIAVTVVRYIDQ